MSIMSITRRDFLQGTAALFGMVMLPFRVKQAAATSAAETYTIPTGKLGQCYFGLDGLGGKLVGDGVQVVVGPDYTNIGPVSYYRHRKSKQTELKHWTSANVDNLQDTDIHIARLSGSVEDMGLFLNTLTMGNLRNLLFSTDQWRGMESIGMAFAFERPIVTSMRRPEYTAETRMDVYGYNGGEDIVVPDAARQMFLSDVHIYARKAPQAVDTKGLWEEWFVKRAMKPGMDYDKLESEYQARRSTMTPEQIAAEEERIRQYANGNADLGVWKNFPKDFAPEKYRKGLVDIDKFIRDRDSMPGDGLGEVLG